MTVKITKDYAPVVSSGARPGIKMSKCIGVTIHNTDNSGVGAGARAHANLLKNSWKNKQQSWHFAVDENGAYQSIPTDEIAWHAGDGGSGKGNTQTIAIEICMNSDGNLEKATDNAAQLAAQQLKEKGLSADKLYQHHDWSGKNCPSQIRAGKPYNWSTFKSKVKAYYNGNTSASKPSAGTGSGSSSSGKKTISQVAKEVINGEWGNGDARKKKLEAAGYDYDDVQAEVNKQLGVSTSTGGGNTSSKKKTVTLPASASRWRVYPTNKAPVVGNECGYLYPSKFGGLTYDILATPQTDVVTIKTRDYGKVNIYVAKSTGAIIK